MKINIESILMENREEIIDKWMEEIGLLKGVHSSPNIPDNTYEATNLEYVEVLFTSIESQGSKKTVEEFTEKVINLGWPLSYITDGLQIFRRILVSLLLKQSKSMSTEEVLDVSRSIDQWLEPINRILVNEYSGNWENIVSLQRVALQELSAPLIPVTEGITIMPLIGTVDTERAKQIMENLLQGVIEHNSEVVLIDITGVPVVDTMVAHHLIQAAEAVRLIGAKCILVGIRPEIAQTIVNLGIDLSSFPTKSTLEKGFKTALEMTNRKITYIESKEESIENLIESLKKV